MKWSGIIDRGWRRRDIKEATPADYLAYLRERDYPFVSCGRERVHQRYVVRKGA
ncbi:hypothetical protein [Methanofollis fontis]|uniref:hypothetical protein n=1 Tax=Methanofollis fontis TaxID=2052832 RepID=UPI0013EE7110|nr:hypothetical protein [Methanofollis fontis]